MNDPDPERLHYADTPAVIHYNDDTSRIVANHHTNREYVWALTFKGIRLKIPWHRIAVVESLETEKGNPTAAGEPEEYRIVDERIREIVRESGDPVTVQEGSET